MVAYYICYYGVCDEDSSVGYKRKAASQVLNVEPRSGWHPLQGWLLEVWASYKRCKLFDQGEQSLCSSISTCSLLQGLVCLSVFHLQWSSISFYETDPDEIRRHLDIINALDEVSTLLLQKVPFICCTLF